MGNKSTFGVIDPQGVLISFIVEILLSMLFKTILFFFLKQIISKIVIRLTNTKWFGIYKTFPIFTLSFYNFRLVF